MKKFVMKKGIETSVLWFSTAATLGMYLNIGALDDIVEPRRDFIQNNALEADIDA